MTTQKQLIREFHVLLNRLGVDEIGKEGILSAYGAESSTQLHPTALVEINEALHKECRKRGIEKKPTEKPPMSDLEKERQRCRVATGKFLARKGYIKADGWGFNEWAKIRSVICRSAKVQHFDEIPLSRLRGLTYEFNKQRQAAEDAAELAANTADMETTIKQPINIIYSPIKK